MRKAIKLLTAIAVISLASCGGGGGSKGTEELYSSSYTGETQNTTTIPTDVTKTGLTIVPDTTKAPAPSYLFVSGLTPKLSCEEGDYTADEVTENYVHFEGDSFTNCTLTFTSRDGRIVYSGLNRFTAKEGSVLKLNEDFTLTAVSGEVTELTSLQDADSDHVADELEDGTTVYDKTVIIVMEGDDLESSALTDFLKRNYNNLVAGISQNPPSNVKFVVIWDGGKEEGLDGSSDVFILDPHSGKDFTVLEQDVESILSGDRVSNYWDDGILYWYGTSDNLSNHLKELIEVAVRMFPAKSYDLIISDHGDGWVSFPTPTTRTVLFEYFNDGTNAGTTWLGTKQFVDEVLAPLSNEGIRFDLIGFDECLMGELTTLSLIAPYGNVLVASPEYEQGDGWGDVWKELPSWYGQGLDTWNIAKKIVDGYITYYKQNPPNVPLAYPVDIALTAVKSESLLQIKDAFEEFAGSLKESIGNVNLYQKLYEDFSENRFSIFFPILVSQEFYTGGAEVLLPQLQQEVEISGDDSYNTLNSSTQLPPPLSFHSLYAGWGYNGLGFDLLFLVTQTGATARYYEVAEESGIVDSPFSPTTVQNALSFLDTYNQVKEGDGLYTKYLYLDMQGGYSENVTGSGLSLIYPYTSPDYAQSPKLELCNYQNFIDSYKDVFPNYTEFVRIVFEEMWKAVRDAGLDAQFTCDAGSGNVVWNVE